MHSLKSTLYLALVCSIFFSCKKNDSSDKDFTNQEILNDFSINVAQGTYNDLSEKAVLLNNGINALVSNPTTSQLENCRQLWKDSRQAWEQSEGFLFGPVSTDNIDPRIDTWPVDYNSLDSVLNSSAVLDDAYINSLDDALKGFHPIEYLLWGANGNKTTAEFTPRQFEYLQALSNNLKNLTQNLSASWAPGAYHDVFTQAGNGSNEFSTEQAAFLEMVSAMASICEEVADGKINDPLVAHDPSLEESPFSGNSTTDFTNNIISVQNVYLGKYKSQGKSLESLVKYYNLSLDSKIKLKINNAISALQSISVPFGEAIISQQTQVTNAQQAINDLRIVLENDLTQLVKQRIQ
ncbi:MAG: imelysin [Bacteroidetes bacterium]|jgi:uncharacterized iron-regulated protein|nr:imelysin [Bacteroidota bacterium]